MELILSLNTSQDENETISKIFEISAGNNAAKVTTREKNIAKIKGERRSIKPFTLKLKYKAINDSNYMQILGDKFVKNNKNKCKFYYLII